MESNQIPNSNIAARRVLIHVGHRYNKKRKDKDGSYIWTFNKRKLFKAILVICGDQFVTRDDEQKCESDFASNELKYNFINVLINLNLIDPKCILRNGCRIYLIVIRRRLLNCYRPIKQRKEKIAL